MHHEDWWSHSPGLIAQWAAAGTVRRAHLISRLTDLKSHKASMNKHMCVWPMKEAYAMHHQTQQSSLHEAKSSNQCLCNLTNIGSEGQPAISKQLRYTLEYIQMPGIFLVPCLPGERSTEQTEGNPMTLLVAMLLVLDWWGVLEASVPVLNL